MKRYIRDARIIVPLLYKKWANAVPRGNGSDDDKVNYAVKVAYMCEKLTGRKVVADVTDINCVVFTFLDPFGKKS